MPSSPNNFLEFSPSGVALPGYAYGLTSVNNTSKKAIIGLLYFTRTWILETNITMWTNSINIMNIRCSWYSQQHRTQSYNKTSLIWTYQFSITLTSDLHDLTLSIIDLLTIRSPIWCYNYRFWQVFRIGTVDVLRACDACADMRTAYSV